MNLQLSIKFIFYVIVSQLLCSFLIGTEKLICFSIFSPKHSNSPLNSSANSLIMKCNRVLNNYEFSEEFLGILYNVNYKCYEQLL